MAEIIFQSKMDAIRFYDHLLKCLSYNHEKNEILLYEDRNIVKIYEGYLSERVLKKTKEAFYEFIIKIKQDDWLRNILKEHYFYEDPEEQQQIMEIIYSIHEGQREDLASFLKEVSEEPNIRAAIEQIFQENVSFSFDSFLRFRLRSYIQKLESYVELSIDEYKMEQEYQMFVQTLREFLVNREPKMEILHLLFDEEITFYTDDFEEIKRGELIKMIDRKLLVNHPVYVDSASIAPLLSLAPTTIFLYAKNPEEPLIRTIKNIFEERVTIKAFDALRSTKKLLLKDDTASENHG
ncbi:putative sporulation protein YtxC [Neobacillus pocheonensis]|uniref:Sporulation protein YtxC n=1 Tax=Neobacillus pocheonensis TaxID=363869 RepID=A0ABT0W7D3_9BACI|nr:putative sporulation protein YtxC [Neobacillus pocheonensis]